MALRDEVSPFPVPMLGGAREQGFSGPMDLGAVEVVVRQGNTAVVVLPLRPQPLFFRLDRLVVRPLLATET